MQVPTLLVGESITAIVQVDDDRAIASTRRRRSRRTSSKSSHGHPLLSSGRSGVAHGIVKAPRLVFITTRG
jgi:hypothetical protein